MIIPITINGLKYAIKSIDSLTVREFIELCKIDDLDHLKYIMWQTKLPYEKVFFASCPENIIEAIGKVPDISKMKKPDRFDYNSGIDTLGQRHQVELCKKVGYELLVFCLAVAQAKSLNIDDVNKLYEKYMGDYFTEILPAGFFFYNRCRNGNNLEQKKSRMLRLLKRTRI